MEMFIIPILIGLIPAFIAQGKGKSFVPWWIYGALIFIIALPHSLIMKADQKSIEKQQLSEGMKKCPYCAEMIKQEAIKCRFCGEVFEDEQTVQEEKTRNHIFPTREINDEVCRNDNCHGTIGKDGKCNECSKTFDEVLSEIEQSKEKKDEEQLNRANEAYFTKGIEHLKSNDAKVAIQYLSKAIESDTRKPEAYCFRAVAYSKLADYQKADRDLRMSISLGYGKAKEVRAKLLSAGKISV